MDACCIVTLCETGALTATVIELFVRLREVKDELKSHI